LRLRWCGFCQHLALTRLSACCLSRCCMHRFASLKQASDAFRFCPTVIPFHLSTVRRCLECDGASINLPRPQRARSASMCWVSTTADILVISAGSCCGLYCTLCFSTWFILSHLLLVHFGWPAAAFSRSKCTTRFST